MLNRALSEFQPPDYFGVEDGRGGEERQLQQKRPWDVIRLAQCQPSAVGEHGADGQAQIAKCVMTPFVFPRGRPPRRQLGFKLRTRLSEYVQSLPLCHRAARTSHCAYAATTGLRLVNNSSSPSEPSTRLVEGNAYFKIPNQ